MSNYEIVQEDEIFRVYESGTRNCIKVMYNQQSAQEFCDYMEQHTGGAKPYDSQFLVE